MVLFQSLVFIASLVVLVWGAEYFVKHSAAIAEKLGLSQFVIGLTLVALGTSVPELASSIFAAIKRDSGFIVGNIVGSNIANIALIVGVVSFITTIQTEEKMLIRDGYIMLFSSALFYVIIINGVINK